MAGLNKTPGANRLHIGFFGKRNSGKSALINAFVNQEVSIVSSEPGTTTDPVYKAMEIDGLGPCLLVDTAGFDDIGTLGQLRNDKTKKASEKIDIAIILFNDRKICQELDWYHYFKEKHIPTILVISKADLQRNDNLLKKITEALKTRRWPEDLPFTKKPVVQYINPSDITGIIDETGDISDHTFVTAMGLLRVGYDTIIGSQDGNSLVEKVNRLLKI